MEIEPSNFQFPRYGSRQPWNLALTKQLVSYFRGCSVVAFRKQVIEKDFQVLFHCFDRVAAGFIGSVNDVDCRFQAGRCGGPVHQRYDRLQCIKQHTATRPTQMRKEATLDGIILRTVRWIVRDANLNAEAIVELLQVVLEDVLSRRIPAAAVTRQEDRCSIGISLLADPVPVPGKTVAGELAGVVPQADVDVASQMHVIVNSVRDHHAVGPTGEVMIKRRKRR
jgi:hypothetical protein